VSVSALPGKSRTNKIWVEMNRNTSKSRPNIIDCDLKKNWQMLIMFGANIFDTTFHQVTVLVPTSPNVCFCTTWEKPNRQDSTKMQYFVGFVSPDSADANSGCSGKLDSHKSCRKYGSQKLLKSDNPSSSYNQKCRRCFFPDMVYTWYNILNNQSSQTTNQTKINKK